MTSRDKMALKDKTKLEHIDIHASLLNVLKKNLEIANRVTFIHRVIYVGDHSFTEDPSIAEAFGTAMKLLEGRGWEPLSGLLLYYERYYIHMIEGPEESIMRHLKRVFLNPKYSPHLKRGKIVVAYHNINQRFFKKWGARTASPPTLLTNLDANANTDEYLRIIRSFLEKMYNLCKFLQIPSSDDEGDNNDDSFEEEQTEDMGEITKEAQDFLPEFALIDYLLQSQQLLDISSYIGQYKYLSALEPFRENVWPIEFEKTPYDVFDIPVDPIEDLLKPEENASEIEVEIEEHNIPEAHEEPEQDDEIEN
ncbi:testis-expressed protein 47-like [Chrysoperla carnea]|uniref:testis-expressed protein 47-like n=1 Tax=Chrysoperla carnea TaxID=189513 RepID=UPI001D06BF05|nr:testis-expressed protein 47-like [Chrysoperla carnea]